MDEDIKLPGSSFEELEKIIQGYAHIDREASLDEVARQVAVHPTVVSRNNQFLVSIGVITGGQKKAITPIGKRLGRAMSFGIEKEVQATLRDIVSENEFMKNLIGAVRIRKGMDESALKAHVAYSAGASKSPGAATGASTIIEMLKRSGAIEEIDGKLIASSTPASDIHSSGGQHSESSHQTPSMAGRSPISHVSPAPPRARQGSASRSTLKCDALSTN
jgi:hypothetical protein